MAPTVDRIDSIIEKLSLIAIDLKSMIAVHEQRINQQEKASIDIQISVEKRREELDIKLKDVYDTIRERDDKLFAEIRASREEHNKHYQCLNEKFTSIQKIIWMAIGGGIVLGYALSFITNYLKILGQ